MSLFEAYGVDTNENYTINEHWYEETCLLACTDSEGCVQTARTLSLNIAVHIDIMASLSIKRKETIWMHRLISNFSSFTFMASCRQMRIILLSFVKKRGNLYTKAMHMMPALTGLYKTLPYLAWLHVHLN